MVKIDSSFDVPTVPEDEQYEGTELDANVRAGKVELDHEDGGILINI
jgi:hypothetical protein